MRRRSLVGRDTPVPFTLPTTTWASDDHGLLPGQVLFYSHCANVNGAPHMRTPSRRSGARSSHAPGGVAARGPPVGVLRSAAHRRAESRFWGVFIIAVHRAFVLGLGARHRGIVKLSEGG